MPSPTFTPPYAPSANGTSYHEEPRVLRAQFGDGYDQTLPDGLNALRMQARLVWSAIPISAANTIVGFLRANKGAVFYYTLPDEGIARKWEVMSWDRDFSGGVIGTVTAELRERFDPS